MKSTLVVLISFLASTSLFAQLTSTTEEVKDGTKTTYLRNGTKILTDEVIFVGENTPKRRIQTQVVWLGDVSVMRIDTFMIAPMRYYYFKDGIEMTEITDTKEILVSRKLPSDKGELHDGFIVGEDGMLTPIPHEHWKISCVPVTGTLSFDKPIEINGARISLVNTENKAVEETEANATVPSP